MQGVFLRFERFLTKYSNIASFVTFGCSSVSVPAPVMVTGTGRTWWGIIPAGPTRGAWLTWRWPWGTVSVMGRMRPRWVIEARMRMMWIPAKLFEF